MRRFLLVMLAALLLFCSCGARENAFTADADGYGYTDSDTGIHYRALDLCFEPASIGAEQGVYRDKKSGYARTFFAVPQQDPSILLADGDGGLWYAGETAPEPSALLFDAIYICAEDAVSVALKQFLRSGDEATVQAICAIWFSGEEISRPDCAITEHRGVKMACAAYPGIYYGFRFCIYEDGTSLFFDPFSGRAVAVPADLTEKIAVS